MSYDTLHSLNKRALPAKMMIYKLAITLFRVYNERMPQFEWLNLNFTQILTSRQANFVALNIPKYKVGNNILTNRKDCAKRKPFWSLPEKGKDTLVWPLVQLGKPLNIIADIYWHCLYTIIIKP